MKFLINWALTVVLASFAIVLVILTINKKEEALPLGLSTRQGYYFAFETESDVIPLHPRFVCINGYRYISNDGHSLSQMFESDEYGYSRPIFCDQPSGISCLME